MNSKIEFENLVGLRLCFLERGNALGLIARDLFVDLGLTCEFLALELLVSQFR